MTPTLSRNSPELLVNTVRPYAWGSTTALADLLGQEPTGVPQAELWMGAHPGAPSRLDRGLSQPTLQRVIATDPVRELGPAVVQRFGPRLPFLLKVLAAEHALSVQVHPTTEQARAGFAREQTLGIPLDADHRTYKDTHHKPELLCALDEFDALCGFRQPTGTARMLASLREPALERWITVLRTRPAPEALASVLAQALGGDRRQGARTAVAVGRALKKAAAARGRPDAVALAAYARVADEFPGDPGIVAALLLNHVRLRPGQALYLGAGIPHAYLHGLGVEIMASSDNVLRCGLTSKHIDVTELLQVADFHPSVPTVLPPEAVEGSPGESRYLSPAAEFSLSRLTLEGAVTLRDQGPQILLCTAGTAELSDSDGHRLTLERGRSAYLPAAGTPVQLRATDPGTVVFRARVPQPAPAGLVTDQ